MMKCVSELYNRYPGSDIYVVGTGPSLRVFPTSLLENKITIGLNMAWKTLPVRYGITIHPDLAVPEFLPGERAHPEITWITKHKKTSLVVGEEQLKYAEENFYFFETFGKKNMQPPGEPSDSGRILKWVKEPTRNRLYMWSSISQAGVNLAANMGAKNIYLVGCDNCALGENHHAHKQHAQWKGADPNHRYHQYYEGLSEIRTALRERGVNLVSMNPFLTLAEPNQDFMHLCQELNKPELISLGADISKQQSANDYFKYYRRQLDERVYLLKQGAKGLVKGLLN